MEEKYNTFFQRLAVIVVGIPLLGYIIFWNEVPFLITIICFNILAIYELQNILTKSSWNPSFLFSTIFSLYFVYVSVNELYVINIDYKLVLAIIAFIFLFSQFIVKNNNIKDATRSIFTTLFSSIYIGYFSSFLLKIKLLPEGNMFLIFLFIIIWMNDTGAFIIGTIFGKKKLAPKISPKKTIEGSIAGISFSFITVIILNQWLHYELSRLLFIGIIIPMVGQFGDLFESILKRRAKIKDSGKLIPGHGGVLDRFDSLLFAAPVFYLCIIYVQ